MALPDLTDAGFLPPGTHRCSRAEFQERFVVAAPHADRRQFLASALDLFVARVEEFLPGSDYVVDGGFVSHKADPPLDVDVLVVANNKAWGALMALIEQEQKALDDWRRQPDGADAPKSPATTSFGGLRTLQNVVELDPYGNARSAAPRVQPFGGLIDSFIFPRMAPEAIESIRGAWTVDHASGTPKGLVEVKFDE